MSDRTVSPWIAIGVSIVSLLISVLTFAIQRISIRDFSYRVGHFSVQNLVRVADQSDTALSLQISLINNGNEPVIVNSIEVFIATKTRNVNLINVKDEDCDRWHPGVNWDPLFLYEPSTDITQDGRGNATENAFGNKVIPTIPVAPYSVTQDQHRFSLFPQLNQDVKIVNGLVCLDVTATAIDGGIHRSPKAIGLLVNAERGKPVIENWYRIRPPILPPIVAEESLIEQGKADDPRSELITLIKNRWWFL